MNKEIVHIDLFSGIGGMHLGLVNAGFKFSHHYFSEIDKHAIANYKYNFPNANYIGSVTDVSGHEIRAKHPNAKIIVTFGWPCQDNSIAGKRKGKKLGTRSGLLFEAGRIIRECKPQTFIAENVKGLFSVNEGNDFYEAIRFLTYLDTDSPQYTVEMQLLNTSWLLPQNRERTYFVGHLGTGCVKRVFPITENDCGATEGSSNATTVRTLTGGGHSGGMHSSMTLIKQVNDSKESGGQQPYMQNRVYDADGIVPALSQLSDRMNIVIKANTASGEETAKEGDTINYSQPNSKTRRGRVGVGVAQTLDTQVNQAVVIAQRGGGKNNEQQLEQSAGDYTNTLTGVQKDNMLLLNEIKYGTEIKRNTKDILSKLWEEIGEEAATKWGFRILDTFQQKEILQSALFRGCDNKEAAQSESRMDDRTLSFKKAQEGLLREMWQQKEFGCSSHRWGLAKQFFEEFTNTLQELSYKGTQGEKELFDLPITTLLQRILHETLSKMEEVRESENDKGEPIYTTNIRRLTEIEVEVLQGFCPDWTKMGNYDGQIKEISRTQRYKMCGNAVTTNIVQLIGIKLLNQ